MNTKFDFIVHAYLRSDYISQSVKMPVSIDEPSLDLAVKTAIEMYLKNYEYDNLYAVPVKSGLNKSLQYKEQLKLK